MDMMRCGGSKKHSKSDRAVQGVIGFVLQVEFRKTKRESKGVLE